MDLMALLRAAAFAGIQKLEPAACSSRKIPVGSASTPVDILTLLRAATKGFENGDITVSVEKAGPIPRTGAGPITDAVDLSGPRTDTTPKESQEKK